MTDRTRQRQLAELARVFLRLGATAFGGPAVHIAMMEDEVVRRRGWLTREEFLDLLGATNLIPGPNSTEMAIHIGLRRAGWPGFAVAGASFIVPATVIVWALAWSYVAYGRLPQVAGVLYGVKPVIIAVIGSAFAQVTPWPRADDDPFPPAGPDDEARPSPRSARAPTPAGDAP